MYGVVVFRCVFAGLFCCLKNPTQHGYAMVHTGGIHISSVCIVFLQ